MHKFVIVKMQHTTAVRQRNNFVSVAKESGAAAQKQSRISSSTNLTKDKTSNALGSSGELTITQANVSLQILRQLCSRDEETSRSNSLYDGAFISQPKHIKCSRSLELSFTWHF
jgi:hypothetical protein